MSVKHGPRLLERAPAGMCSHMLPTRLAPAGNGTRPASICCHGGRQACGQRAAERVRASCAATADLASVLPEARGSVPGPPFTGSDLREGTAADGGSPPQPRGRGAQDPVLQEIHGCEEIEDVLEVLDEEADGTAGYLVADAALKCVQLAKRRAGRPGKTARAELQRAGHSDAFQALMEWMALKAPEMEGRDLAVCLWSLATMRIKVVRLLRLLQQQLEQRMAGLNAQDIAMTVWAFGSLKHSPGRLMDALAQAAAPQLAAFRPQGLSMTLWAYAKLDHCPPRELLDGVLAIMLEQLDEFSPQSVANIVYAFGKLQRSLPAQLCERVQALVAADPARFKDIELANMLYGFVYARFQSPQLLAAIEDRIAAWRLEEQTLGVTWATLVWGAGSLGLQLRDTTLAALADWAFEQPEAYTPLSVCNMLWGMAILGHVQHPAFSRVLAAAVACHQRRALEPRLLRQLFQAATSARLLGGEADVPEELEATAYKWWRKATLGLPVSVNQDAVAQAARRLGLAFETQADAGYGRPLVDLAFPAPDGGRLAVRVASSAARAVNTRAWLGRARHDRRLLEAAGWRVAELEVGDLPPLHDKPALTAFLGRWLSERGIPCDWQAAADAAPKPAPPSVRMRPQARSAFRGERLGGKRERRRRDPAAAGGAASAEGRQAPAGARQLQQQQPRADQAPASPAATPRANSQPVESAARELPWGASAQIGAGSPANVGAGERSREEQQQHEAEQQREQARAEEVADALGGDFLSDWVGLGDWKALRVVQPTATPAGE